MARPIEHASLRTQQRCPLSKPRNQRQNAACGTLLCSTTVTRACHRVWKRRKRCHRKYETQRATLLREGERPSRLASWVQCKSADLAKVTRQTDWRLSTCATTRKLATITGSLQAWCGASQCPGNHDDGISFADLFSFARSSETFQRRSLTGVLCSAVAVAAGGTVETR